MNFTIGAVDGGGNTKVIPIYVEITDINDNNPMFDTDRFTGMVSENANVGTQVLIVTATDIDLGQFANLTYSLTGGNGAFTIDPVTVSEIYWTFLFVWKQCTFKVPDTFGTRVLTNTRPFLHYSIVSF